MMLGDKFVRVSPIIGNTSVLGDIWVPKSNGYQSLQVIKYPMCTVAHKTVPMFDHFEQMDLVWSDDIS